MIRRAILIAAGLSAFAGVSFGAVGTASASASAGSLVVTSKPRAPSGVTPITFTAQWSTATAGAHVTVDVDPSSVRKCPLSPAADHGVTVIDTVAAIYGTPQRSQPTTFPHGRYLVCGWLFGPSGTLATDHHTLTISNPDRLSLAVPASAVDGTTSSITFSGVSDVQDPIIYVKRNPASQKCRSNPKNDHGQVLSGAAPAPGTRGAFTSTASIALGTGPTGTVDGALPGVYTVCAWLLDGRPGEGGPLIAPASTRVTLTAPTGTLAYSVPELVRAGHTFKLTAKYETTATDLKLYVDLKPLPAAGATCGASHAHDPGAVKLVVLGKPGVKTETRLRLRSAGAYLACAWLEWPHGAVDGPFEGRMVVARRHQTPTYWCGTTAQHLRASQTHHASCAIEFATIDGQVVYLSYWAEFTCTAPGRRPSHKTYETSFPVFGMTSRRTFSGTYEQGSDHAAVSARLKRKRGRGSLSESYRSDAYTCASGVVGFKVRRA